MISSETLSIFTEIGASDIEKNEIIDENVTISLKISKN